MFTFTTSIVRPVIVCHACKNKNTKPENNKEQVRSLLRVKLSKALKYCDYTKETDHKISDACHVLWDEIDELSIQIKNST